MTAVTAPAWRQCVARVARHVDYGAGHRWLDLEIPVDGPAPRPGQFMQLRLDPTASAAFLPRPMSVAAVRRGGRVMTLGFLYAAVGIGTRALAALPEGAVVETLGPLGHGFPLERPGAPVLIAGGRGVAPLLFAAEALGRAGRRCEFLFGARDKAHLVAADDASKLLSRLRGHLTLCTDDGSRGTQGNVVDLLNRKSRSWRPPIVVYACGPHAMLAGVAQWAMANDAEAWLAMESVMACGTGVCRGCPLPRSAGGRERFSAEAPSLLGNRELAMCCTEGPVFEARDLDWDAIH